MKKINYLYFVSALFFVIIISRATMTYAWSNGYLVGTHELDPGWGQHPVPVYQQYYTMAVGPNTLRRYYGTHDWIAESALKLLYNIRPDNEFLGRLQNYNDPDNLIFYYLYGTEIPDLESGVPSYFQTRCGNRYEPQFQSHKTLVNSHNRLYFFENGDIKEDSACQAANALYYEIQEAFKIKDCQLAATFIGALMHVIADATFYYHVLEGINVGRPEYQTHVLHVTFRTWSDVNFDRNNEFFNLDEVINKLTVMDQFSPYFATLWAGLNTRFGSFLYKDAEFLLNNAPTTISHHYWTLIEGYWSEYSQENTWTHSMRPSTADDFQAYFDTVEHNLNQAVYYCAATLNYIINNAGYTDCQCSGENPPQEQNPPSGDGDRDRVGIPLATSEFSALLFFNAVGLASTAIAFTMMKLIEKVLQEGKSLKSLVKIFN